MIACMQRIQGSTKFRSNLHSDWNSDLRSSLGITTRRKSRRKVRVLFCRRGLAASKSEVSDVSEREIR
jgi:hypothetical protein